MLSHELPTPLVGVVALALAVSCAASAQRTGSAEPQRAAASESQSRAQAGRAASSSEAPPPLEQLEDDTLIAVQRLGKLYEQTLAQAGSRDHPDVQTLVDKIADPLAIRYVERYVEHGPRTRSELMKLLASLSDPRIEPAIRKSLEEFVRKPTGMLDREDLIWAIRAQGALKIQMLNPLLLGVFTKLRASTMLGARCYEELDFAMLAIADPSWATSLRGMLGAGMSMPRPGSRAGYEDYRDQLFWHSVSIRVLGKVSDAEAARPLLSVLLDPEKAPVHSMALLALINIGKPSVEAAARLLRGEDRELVARHRAHLDQLGRADPGQPEPHVPVAALVLGASGRSDALPPLTDRLATTRDATVRAVLLRELARLPATPRSKREFQQGFERVPLGTFMPASGGEALRALAEEAVVRFHDPGMIHWLVARGLAAVGDLEQLKDLRSAILITVLRLARKKDLPLAARTLATWGNRSRGKIAEQPQYDLTRAMLSRCGERTECYLEALKAPEAQQGATRWQGIKAATMLAIHGDASTADALVVSLGGVHDAVVRRAMAQAIDHLLPRGSDEVAQRLEGIFDADRRTGNKEKIATDAPLLELVTRLRARAR